MAIIHTYLLYSILLSNTSISDTHMMMSPPDKILLTEVSMDNEFIEIYNPNNHAVDLSDVYVTDAVYNPNMDLYYHIVSNEHFAGGGGFLDFHARFPDGASIPAGAYQTISIRGSDNFMAAFGQLPTYELFEDNGSPDGIPDMREAFSESIDIGSVLSNAGEVVILYTWDGTTDLVQDIDYVVWGDKAEGVDKTGVSKDGPDADMVASTYSDDTPIADQEVPVYMAFGLGLSFHRVDYTEGTQTMTGGNGITGADETSENLSQTWQQITYPTPNANADCNNEIVLDYPIGSAQYNANATLSAKGTKIVGSKEVVFAAGQEIIFSDNFEIDLGSTLETIIQTCK